MDYQLEALPNGIKYIYREVNHTKIAHCGIILDIGSRDENENEIGLAHFWEHMAFKGTKKRKAFHILNRIDSLGGELNAYTTKEKICFYSSTLNNHLEKSLELLTDITFSSVFPERQLVLERNVVLEEISMYFDSPEDAIQDEFDSMIFQDHTLGNNILGTEKTVRNFTREQLMQFIANNLDTDRIIFSFSGSMPFRQVRKLMEKHVGKLPAYKCKRVRHKPQKYIPGARSIYRPIMQSHGVLGKPAYHLTHPERVPFFLMNNLLGGSGLNTRLNLSLREKYGFVYSVDAIYNAYTDTGIFSVFFASEPSKVDKCYQLILKEFKKLKERPLGTVQLHQAKEQLIGQMAMSEENNVAMMLSMAKRILDTGYIEPFDEVIDKIRGITSKKIQEIANECLVEEEFSYLTLKPEQENGLHT